MQEQQMLLSTVAWFIVVVILDAIYLGLKEFPFLFWKLFAKASALLSFISSLIKHASSASTGGFTQCDCKFLEDRNYILFISIAFQTGSVFHCVQYMFTTVRLNAVNIALVHLRCNTLGSLAPCGRPTGREHSICCITAAFQRHNVITAVYIPAELVGHVLCPINVFSVSVFCCCVGGSKSVRLLSD